MGRIGKALSATIEALSPRSSSPASTTSPGSAGSHQPSPRSRSCFKSAQTEKGEAEEEAGNEILSEAQRLEGLRITSPRRRAALRQHAEERGMTVEQLQQSGITLADLEQALAEVCGTEVNSLEELGGAADMTIHPNPIPEFEEYPTRAAADRAEDGGDRETPEEGPQDAAGVGTAEDEAEPESSTMDAEEMFSRCEAQFGLSEEEVEIWRGVWTDFDTTCDGVLSREELRAGLLKFSGKELSESQLDAALATGSSTEFMSYHDFLQFMECGQSSGSL